MAKPERMAFLTPLVVSLVFAAFSLPGFVNNELEVYRSPTSIGGGLQPNRQEQ
jgi:hypothetical protein